MNYALLVIACSVPTIGVLCWQLKDRTERIEKLEDRLMASSLTELKVAQQYAMPLDPELDESGTWAYDPTGLVREWIPNAE